MSDQATQLRRLAREAHATCCVAPCARPRMIAVAGGKGGVGTTTIAVNLAVALAGRQYRTVLADMSPAGSDAAMLCRIRGRASLADVLSGRRDAADILEAGPGGVQVLPGDWGGSESWLSDDPDDSAEERLFEQFQSLGPIADFMVVDAGNTPTPIAQRVCHAGERVLLVATPELASVINAYATVKGLTLSSGLAGVDTVVNMAATETAAEDVHARLALACRRFLGIEPRAAGYVPWSSEVEQSGRRGEPVVLAAPDCLASRQIARLASVLAGN